MTDTPKHIEELQLKIWLSKTPDERLMQLLKDNEALYLFWKNGKEQLNKTTSSPPILSAT